MTALIAGFGFAWDVSGGDWLHFTVPTGGALVGLIALGVFVALTLAREIDLALQQKPKIEVEAKVYNEKAFLEVKNTGGEANFSAKARVIASNPQPALYTMYWESVYGPQCHIDGDGGMASILVGEKADRDNRTMDINTFFMKGDFVLFRTSEGGRIRFPAFSGRHSERIEQGVKVISGTAIQRCILEVTITSTPKLRTKWGTHRYLCGIEGGEIIFTETDLSNPHIVDSQTELT